MLIDSLYNSVSQNILSIFGNTMEMAESEANQNQASKANTKGVTSQTSSGDKVSISAEALALYNQQRQVESSETSASEEEGANVGGQGGGNTSAEDTSSITSQIQALQSQLAALSSQVNADDPLSVSQIEQIRTQISILQAQLNS